MDASSAKALLWPVEKLKPLSGSSDVLRRLKDRFPIVYLTARNFRYAARTKTWLALWGFPTAPVIFRRPHFWNLPSADCKARVMAELAGRWKSIRFGVGDRSGDMRAYAAAGARPLLIGSNGRNLPEGTIPVRSWRELEQHIAD